MAEKRHQLVYTKSTRCGYCHQKKPVEKSWPLPSIAKVMVGKGYCNSCSITFQGEDLELQEYEDLMKDGWRRSGSFMYKPDLLRSCCRQFTIRTNYEMFIEDGYYNKSNKKTIRRFYKAMGVDETPAGSLLETYLKKDKKNKFTTVLLPNTYSQDKFELFKKYQMSVHNEDESEVRDYSFYSFLCDDPFPERTPDDNIDWMEVNRQWRTGNISDELLKLQGPVHECYIIDKKLVAIAVLDILPTTISSVYFIWDPNYAHLGLGTVSAIREIIMAKLLKKDHYYMGFYIADCDKMIYKSKFGGEIRNFRREEKTGKKDNSLQWVKLLHVNSTLQDGGLKVFDKTEDGKYVDVAEKQYGINDSLNSNDITSFKVVNKTCIFETPSVIPGIDL